MGPVSAEVDLDVPREVAYRFVADLANRPAFTDHFISDLRLSRVESTGVGAGARYRIFAPPQAVWVDTTITALTPPTSLPLPHRRALLGCCPGWSRTGRIRYPRRNHGSDR